MEGNHDHTMEEHFSKLERMIADQVTVCKNYLPLELDYFQAYESIHRFENLQRQNNLIIHRISTLEDMMVANHNLMASTEILNNGRTVYSSGINDLFNDTYPISHFPHRIMKFKVIS